jgi:hypothetical protein
LNNVAKLAKLAGRVVTTPRAEADLVVTDAGGVESPFVFSGFVA